MISVLLHLALAAAPVDSPGPGTLVGCAFLADGAGEKQPAFLGLAIYLPADRPKGPIPAALIRDPNGFIGPSGFDRIEWGSGWIRFAGATSLRLEDGGGGIFRARLNGVDKPGSCQVGQFPDPDSAFAFFDDVIRGVNTPD